jgi:hypothetical protein
MTDTEKIKTAIINNVDEMAKALKRGKDLELRKEHQGVAIREVKKTLISK